MDAIEYYEIDGEKTNIGSQEGNQVGQDRTNTPSYSWMRFVIPFETNPELKDSLTQAKTNKIRNGRLLEMMDFISGRVSYRHCYSYDMNAKVCTNVTASVDGLQLFNQNEHNLDENLIIDG